ncbi:MAG: hypothetical protein LAP39_24945 [Acidobacteriia bacterium]|nr:hypothetical protein [Terriglobia bacterium]
MPNYRIYRMKDNPREHFRSAPHVSGAANVKRRDYEEGGQIEAASDYAAWENLRASEKPLEVGDLLETDGGELRICKYIGFEAAVWVLPAAATEPTPAAAPIGYTSGDQPAGEQDA